MGLLINICQYSIRFRILSANLCNQTQINTYERNIGKMQATNEFHWFFVYFVCDFVYFGKTFFLSLASTWLFAVWNWLEIDVSIVNNQTTTCLFFLFVSLLVLGRVHTYRSPLHTVSNSIYVCFMAVHLFVFYGVLVDFVTHPCIPLKGHLWRDEERARE